MVMTRPLTRTDAETFLFHEARLLDERRLEKWLELFTKDGTYWLPIDENTDPEVEPSILYDDSETRAQRVYQLLHQPHYAQMPASRTLHTVSNVQVEEGADGEAVIRYALVVHELRPGDPRQFGLGQQRAFAGQAEYQMRFEEGWKIHRRIIVLLNRDMPLENMTFIL